MQQVMLGNEAIARGLLEKGCTFIYAYPGTPSSEILPAFIEQASEHAVAIHGHWSVNEKIALESAFTAAMTGLRSAAVMKQVGLNVAADAFLSIAYLGVTGGLVVISADDPGPNSSQTEQDSRMFALFAKVAVFDPATPQEAALFAGRALELSAEIGLPVLLRPTATLCHARQNISLKSIIRDSRNPEFVRQPQRWAATPKHRLQLHQKLNQKMLALACDPRFDFADAESRPTAPAPYGIIASGCAWALTADVLSSLPQDEARQFVLYKVDLPYPLHKKAGRTLLLRHARLLVVEESQPVIEYQLGPQEKICGRNDGTIPNAGALTPEIIRTALALLSKRPLPINPAADEAAAPGKRPSLCPGCPHRSSFYALKKALPHGIYAGDIGCYTLGINLNALDSCLCMGASISQAGSFYQTLAHCGADIPPLAAVIGDSTFYHSGIPALVNARWEGSRFVLFLLDNSTTAMTGNQPTPAAGLRADGSRGPALSLEKIIQGCGIEKITVVDPYRRDELIAALKTAWQYCMEPDGGIAVVIARRGCLMIPAERKALQHLQITISEACTGCGYCLKAFECPALIRRINDPEKRVTIDPVTCVGCGQCVAVCPQEAIQITGS
ncbi:MAG: 4Fe-4S dicluster domain-containing protein [Deltaproteobacteria bacterium]|nr:4Fe-4S dicluster domain-containing protein [Deltaproteobacteria bacterium]